MFVEDKGANEFSLEELEALFKAEENPEPLPEDDSQKTPPVVTPPVDTKKEITKGVADRIKAVRLEEQNAIAKTMGYDSYDAMMKSKEEKLLKDKGYDPKDLAPVVDELVKTRLENDSRIKELELLKKERVAEFAKRELAEIAKITDGEITTLDQLPKDVLEDWKKTGSLKSSFLLLRGEEYITKAKAGRPPVIKGGTDHLRSLGGGANMPAPKTRLLTADEKMVWKQFHPTMSEEDLNKKTVPID